MSECGCELCEWFVSLSCVCERVFVGMSFGCKRVFVGVSCVGVARPWMRLCEGLGRAFCRMDVESGSGLPADRPLSVTFVQVTANWPAPQTLPCGGWAACVLWHLLERSCCRCSRRLPETGTWAPAPPRCCGVSPTPCLGVQGPRALASGHVAAPA